MTTLTFKEQEHDILQWNHQTTAKTLLNKQGYKNKDIHLCARHDTERFCVNTARLFETSLQAPTQLHALLRRSEIRRHLSLNTAYSSIIHVEPLKLYTCCTVKSLNYPGIHSANMARFTPQL